MSEISHTRASSPVSTGGDGTFFEQHVDALFIALLLVRAPLPILKDCQVEEVHLQTEHLGWKTDDVMVVAIRPDGVRRRLVVQVKRKFTVSANDDICKKAFGDFWADFKNPDFNPALDRFALVTLRGTNVLLGGFNSLLDQARAAANATDFTRRLEVDGFISKASRDYAKTIRQIIQKTDEAPTDEQFWRFLSVLHVVSFDLNTASAQTEGWIKVLLAATSNASGQMTAAEASWRELLELVGTGMPSAASYLHANLPEGLRKRHGPIGTRATDVVRSLSDHSSVTLAGIKTTIGTTSKIVRDTLINQVLGTLNENQVVLITAPAGLGKSVVAKNCVELLSRDFYCLAFRAEEFAVSHIDQTLQLAQVRANGTELLGILAGQGRKLVLVESVERLLEASTRDAFADLLNLAKQDRGLGLLITCRDYSLETVSSALLGQAGLAFKVVEVPPLADHELDQSVAMEPQLSNAFRNEGLKRLLRSPYLLDKAARMDWSHSEGVPTNEREFRKRCWEEVVRRNISSSDGMPDRRERAFEEVALRRARQLRPFIEIGDLDAAALESLRHDGLILASSEASTLAAPGHDVLEDWALIQWIGRRWVLHEKAAGRLAEDVGGYPAIRRAYRKWLSELLRENTATATDFVLSVFRERTLPAYFRDDTLVCTLQSSLVRPFLQRHREALFQDGGRLLVRVIHLMRVACKASPQWLHDAARVPSQLLVASGEAWAAVLELVLGGIDLLSAEHIPTALGLIEDFAGAIEWRDPEPKGFEEAAKIGFHLLTQLDAYRMSDMRKRTLTVIAKMPRGDATAFKAMIEQVITADPPHQHADEVSDLLLGGLDGWAACRYFPEEIIRLVKSEVLLSDQDLEEHDRRSGYSFDIEPIFGIKEHANRDYFPASSIRSVFFPLLRHHPRRAIDFIIELLNHSGTWYGEQRWSHDRLELAHRVTIEVPGEAPVRQWANPRLWNLFRGHSVGPYVLQTALMALEAWLLDIGKIEGVDVESWLLKILKDSNNVMATAVVASICNAYPEKSGRAGLALLSARELISMDRARMAQEHSHSVMSEFLPGIGINRLFEDERKASDALPHRKHDLDALAVILQLGTGREKVQAMIDGHRAALPPVEEQTEAHRLWRLALHRMDVRGFRAVDTPSPTVSGETVECATRVDKPQGRQFILAPGEIEPDVQAIIERHAPIAAQQERDLTLLNWGNSAWEGKDSAHLDIRDWQAVLARARARDAEPEPDDFTRGGPGLIAAVCARDHWDTMSPDDRTWCIDKLIREVERDCDTHDAMARHGRGASRPDRHAAYVLPSLLARDVSQAQVVRINEAIAKALTHEAEEVVTYAAEGIGAATATGELRAFSEGCSAAIAWQAQLILTRLADERKRPIEKQLLVADIIREIIPAVRTAIIARDRDPRATLANLDLHDWPGTQAARIILQILGHAQDSSLAIEFHRRIASSIVEVWASELNPRSRHGQRDHQFIYDFFRRLARFALRLDHRHALHVCEPLLKAVAEHPREVNDFVRDLVFEADRTIKDDSFWALWQAFADAICAAPWIEQIDSPHGTGRELVGAIFLGGHWKEDVRHWHKLDGEGHRVDELAARFRKSTAVFDAYCRFLFDIGDRSLPGAFVCLADSLTAGSPSAMLADRNTVFRLETLLQRHVYAMPHRLKSVGTVRTAVLALLDHLVEAGSSAAYRMRDDFVTPLSDPGHC